MGRSAHQAVTIAIILLNAYCFGAGCVERFINYQTWDHIDPASFREYHRAQSPLIRMFIVVPLAVCFALQIFFLSFYREAGVSSVVAWTMVGSSMAGALSTIFVQLPIHARFESQGYSSELMNRLLATDWIRKAADLVRMVATIALLHRVLRI